MALTLIKNAKAIVTVDDNDRVIKNGYILIEDDEIKSVGEGVPAQAAALGAEVIDASDMFVYPGLVSTHHHLYQTFTRNLPKVQSMELFDWLTTLYEIWRGLDSECIYYSSLTGMGELLKYGCTTCLDHHYVFPKKSDDFIDRQFEAAQAIGMRFHATRGSMSRGKSDGGLPPDDLVQDIDTILADSERLIKKYHDASRHSMRNVALAPCSPFSVTTKLLKASAELARKYGVRLHTHLCETKDEEGFCLEKLGMRPLEYMQSCGWVGSDVWFAHGIHFKDEELELLARTGTGVAHCPVSNMKLASGVCRVPDMLRLGVPVGLAVDGSASNDCSNMLAEIRASYLLHRLTYSNLAPTGYDILKLATRGSARLLGRDDLGAISAGMSADLFMLDTTALELAGTLDDPANLLGTVGYNRPAALVMVNGKVVVKDGELMNIDERGTARKANELAKKLCADK